ncbi:hypothetical protein A2U01_0036029, partial [Trifolium medium]|nr:hypothetical protein [Trifolium medium]
MQPSFFLGSLVARNFTLKGVFISEPEEVLSSQRNKAHNHIPNIRNQKSHSKFNKLGLPKCLQLAEAVKSGGGRARKRRLKGESRSSAVAVVGGDEVIYPAKAIVCSHQNKTLDSDMASPSITPTSGINLLSVSGNSKVLESVCDDLDIERDKLVEAAKL